MKHVRYCMPLMLVLLLLLPCLSPGLARWLLESLSVPGMALLHRLTAPASFPVTEPLAMVLLLLAPAGLIHARTAGSLAPLKRLAAALLSLLVVFMLLWTPALSVPVPDFPAPNAGQLCRVCARLVEQLNASHLAFPADALARAPLVAGAPARAVKAARLPGWMALARVWGIFIPLTGEAIVDPAEPAPLVPFTAVHELMHLSGIVDEGAANVAAWERCMAAGGPFADSARLWALRYAMGQLHRADPAAWRKMRAKMEGATLRAFLDCGGEAESAPRRLFLARGSYAALTGYLAGYAGA